MQKILSGRKKNFKEGSFVHISCAEYNLRKLEKKFRIYNKNKAISQKRLFFFKSQVITRFSFIFFVNYPSNILDLCVKGSEFCYWGLFQVADCEHDDKKMLTSTKFSIYISLLYLVNYHIYNFCLKLYFSSSCYFSKLYFYVYIDLIHATVALLRLRVRKVLNQMAKLFYFCF